ncbi:MAG TPA: hypothetical protein VNT79_08970 [Phycisphaerae bacterium]|nr:hypothetical protein [Phycisphaerae bacterium]
MVRAADAHPILISRGAAVIEDDQIAVKIEVCAEDFLHNGLLSQADGQFSPDGLNAAAQKYRETLLQSFAVRDQRGERLEGRVDSVRFDQPPTGPMAWTALRRMRITYGLKFPLTQMPLFLTFRFHAAESSASAPSQLLLFVSKSRAAGGKLLQLTSRGNAETIEVAALAKTSGNSTGVKPVGSLQEDRFQKIQAFVTREAKTIRMDVYIPLAVMETFVPIARRSEDFIEAEEAGKARAALEEYFRAHPPATLKGSSAKGLARMERVVLVAPGEERIEDVPPASRRIGAWSARVGVRLRWSNMPSGAQALEWGLFNASVMNATAWTDRNGRSVEQEVIPGDARIEMSAVK